MDRDSDRKRKDKKRQTDRSRYYLCNYVQVSEMNRGKENNAEKRAGEEGGGGGGGDE